MKFIVGFIVDLFLVGCGGSGGVRGGFTPARGQRVRKGHPGPHPAAPGISLWSRGYSRYPPAKCQLVSHPHTPHRQPRLHTAALGLLQRYWSTARPRLHLLLRVKLKQARANVLLSVLLGYDACVEVLLDHEAFRTVKGNSFSPLHCAV